ncbi:MAG: hypothetical protein EOO43_01390 [Flavobacterium sp.]|nr:MAG: hypothetical protein EOO43_01390 [Flavobacterium sp.]
MDFDFLKKIDPKETSKFRYSICTLVTKPQEYREMVSSFVDAGFNTEICEFLYLDNSLENNTEAYQGVNLFLSKANGKYIIICHQDILIDKDRIEDLDRHLKLLDEKDHNWGICGNAGAAGPNYIVYHISYPNDVFKHKGNFPVKVTSLDENFILIKNSARLAVSQDLSGFHLYGTDLCLNAEMRGCTSYAISFNLTHKSYGNRDGSFYSIRTKFIAKYNRFFRSRWIQSPSTVFHLSGSIIGRLLGNPLSLFFVRMINGVKKRKHGR